MSPEQEARASRTRLIHEYGNRSPMLRRRWRVEGSQAGNSRLLTRPKAIETKARYGGQVCQVIPMVPLENRLSANMPKCPFCKVAKGKPCETRSGKISKPHLKRWEAFHAL